MKQICVIIIFLSFSNSQIAYPEENPTNSDPNNNGRQPVYVPGLCPLNEWYWPGNQKTDWVCDCASRFVYHPTTDMCHELFRQGPCQNNEYLVLEKGKIIPECIQNPCKNDTIVPFNGKCSRLYKNEACQSVGLISRILNVNHSSLQLECMLESVAELNAVSIVLVPCLPGSKRSASGKCRVIVP